MTDPGSQRSKRMPLNCPAEIADKTQNSSTSSSNSRRQFVDLKLIDHVSDIQKIMMNDGTFQFTLKNKYGGI
jgi:hypothetical protein